MPHPFSILVLLFLLLFPAVPSQCLERNKTGSPNVIIGAVVDSTSKAGKQEKIAIQMAMDDLSASMGLRPLLFIKESQGDPIKAAFSAQELIRDKHVEAIVGLRTWKEASSVAEYGNIVPVPIVSLAAVAPSRVTSEQWPFLLRVASSSHEQMKAVAAIVSSWKWRAINIIYEDNFGVEGGIASLICPLNEANLDAGYQSVFPPFRSLSNPAQSIAKELEKMKKKSCRVFIVHSSFSLGTLLFSQAKRMGMMEKDYVWIATEHILNHLDSANISEVSSMSGVVGVKTYFPKSSQQVRDFSTSFRRRFRMSYPEEDDSELGIYPLRAYDAVSVILKAAKQLQSAADEEENPSSAGRALLKEILSSNFQGLSGHIQFEGKELVPARPALQIVNVVESGYRELGFWSPSSGFTKTPDEGANGQGSMESLGHVIWPGDPLYVPRGFVTGPKPLKIGVPADSPYESILSVKYNRILNSTKFDGFSYRVFEMVLKRLTYGFNYTPIPQHGTYDSLFVKLDNEFDAVVGDTAIIGWRCKYGEFTQPYSESGVQMVVPVKQQQPRAWIFIRPFTTKVWLLTVAIVLYNGLAVWIIERREGARGSSARNEAGALVWNSVNTLFSLQGENPRSNLSRMATIVWLFVAFVLTSSYTASLSSMLTVQRLEPTVVDVESLRETKAKVGCDRGSFVRKYLEETLRFDRSNIVPFDTADGYPEAFKSGKIKAAFLEVPYIKYLFSRHCGGLTVAGPVYQIGGFAFAFTKGSNLVADFSEVIVKMREEGTLKELEGSLVTPNNCSSTNMDKENDSLGLDSFWALFTITFATSTLALLIYWGNILYSRNNNLRSTSNDSCNNNVAAAMAKATTEEVICVEMQPSINDVDRGEVNSKDICIFRRSNTI